jgi:phage terminase small subunit
MPVLRNAKQELFAQEIAKGATLILAYERAGYKPDIKNAKRLRDRGDVTARVDELLQLAGERSGVTIDNLIDELRMIAFSDLRKAVKWGSVMVPGVMNDEGENDGPMMVHDVYLTASTDLDGDTARAIGEVRKTKDGLSIKMHDKLGAIEKLGRYLGAWKDKQPGSDETSPMFVKWLD